MIDSTEILNLPPPRANHRIQYGEGEFHFGDLRLPETREPIPLVVVIHGGYWRARYGLEHSGHMCASITALGYATWNLEYRRLGNVGGGFPGTFLDVAAGMNYARELARLYPIDLARVVVVGHSAGGQLALWLAGADKIPHNDELPVPDIHPIRGVVSLAGVLDLRRAWEMGLSNRVTDEFMGGGPKEYPGRYAAASPYERLPLNRRQILLHGTSDVNVPFEIGESYFQRARAAGDDVSFIPLPGIGHFELIDPRSTVWPEVENAINRALA